MMAIMYKLVESITEHYGMDCNLESMPWVKSWTIEKESSTGGERTWPIKVARIIAPRFFATKEELEEFIAAREEENRNEVEYDKTKVIYRGRVEFDDEFIEACKDGYKTARGFGEFGFSERKAFKKAFREKYGTSRDKRDYIKWALDMG